MASNTPFKMKGFPAHAGTSPAKKSSDQVVDGVLCDAYGNPKPSAEQIKAGTATPDFKNKAKGKNEKGLFGPSKDKSVEKQKEKVVEKNEEADKAQAKAQKKANALNVMNESIDATLGKSGESEKVEASDVKIKKPKGRRLSDSGKV